MRMARVDIGLPRFQRSCWPKRSPEITAETSTPTDLSVPARSAITEPLARDAARLSAVRTMIGEPARRTVAPSTIPRAQDAIMHVSEPLAP
jgi:hypothetical protein